MVEIFKTTIENKEQAEVIISLLKKHFTDYSANFDLEDCDRILRIEAERILVEPVMHILESAGIFVEVLED